MNLIDSPTPGRGPSLKSLLTPRVTIRERTPDGHPKVWLLYRPEPFAPGSDDDRAIHLWVRRCDVFTSERAALSHLYALLGPDLAASVRWREHELFPELTVGVDRRGCRWLLTWAPVDAGVPRG